MSNQKSKIENQKMGNQKSKIENQKSFSNLLFHTAFCCMTCDGDIDKREVALLNSMCAKLPLFEGFDFQTEANLLIDKLNKEGKEFMTAYLHLLKTSSLTEDEEAQLIDIAIQTIKADDVVMYSEVKFFKTIRHRLKISDEKILEKHPDFEQYLEQDIITETLLERITKQYLDIAELPKFEAIKIDGGLLEAEIK